MANRQAEHSRPLHPTDSARRKERNARDARSGEGAQGSSAAEEARAGLELQLPSRKGLLRCAMILLLVLTHISAFMLGYYLMPARVPFAVGPQLSPDRALSRVTRDLGRQAFDFTLPAQAQAMLRFMVDKPGRKIYELRFSNGLMRFELQADLDSQVLSLRQTMPDGSGKVSRWEGQVLERLQQAAAGQELGLEEGSDEPAETQFFQKPLRRSIH